MVALAAAQWQASPPATTLGVSRVPSDAQVEEAVGDCLVVGAAALWQKLQAFVLQFQVQQAALAEQQKLRRLPDGPATRTTPGPSAPRDAAGLSTSCAACSRSALRHSAPSGCIHRLDSAVSSEMGCSAPLDIPLRRRVPPRHAPPRFVLQPLRFRSGLLPNGVLPSTLLRPQAPRNAVRRRYRQDTTHPGVPTTGAPARWSRSAEVASESDDDDCSSSSHSRRRKKRSEHGRDGREVVDLMDEQVFAMEEPVYGKQAP